MPYLTFGPFENTPHDEYLEDEHDGGILHRSRTLDQFYHSMQDEKRARDQDQVFTRYVDRKLSRNRKSDVKTQNREHDDTQNRDSETKNRENDETQNTENEKTQNREKEETSFDILRVNQLWLWVIDESK